MLCLDSVVNGSWEGTQGYLMSAEESYTLGKSSLSKSVDDKAPFRTDNEREQVSTTPYHV